MLAKESRTLQQRSTVQFYLSGTCHLGGRTKSVLLSLLNLSLECVTLFTCSVVFPNRLQVFEKGGKLKQIQNILDF